MSRTDDPLKCIICDATMVPIPGKAMCPNCGYQEDGTDLFPPDPPARHPAPTFHTPISDLEDTLFPLGPELPKQSRRRPPRPRPPLPPMGWLFHNN
jgi:hypothetical protein